MRISSIRRELARCNAPGRVPNTRERKMACSVSSRICQIFALFYDFYACQHFFSVEPLTGYSITKTCPCNIQRFFSAIKNENFIRKMLSILLSFAQNIDYGYTLEPPRRGGSNVYSQSMFWSKNNKNRYTPAYPSFVI